MKQFNKDEVKSAVLDYISANNHVSYAELEWFFQEKQIPFEGNLEIISEKCEHVVFWSGWNKEILDAIGELFDEGKIHREPAQMLIYSIDGRALDMPIVKQYREYKTDHWLPTVFCIGPEEYKTREVKTSCQITEDG